MIRLGSRLLLLLLLDGLGLGLLLLMSKLLLFELMLSDDVLVLFSCNRNLSPIRHDNVLTRSIGNNLDIRYLDITIAHIPSVHCSRVLTLLRFHLSTNLSLLSSSHFIRLLQSRYVNWLDGRHRHLR